MFDLKTYKPLSRVHAAEDADAVIYDRASERVFTFNGDAHSSTVIDAANGTFVTNIYSAGKLVTTVPIGAGVDGAGFDPATGNAFASAADGTLTVIHRPRVDSANGMKG